MINDEEDFLKALQSFLKDNLNTEIAAINTEKGDHLLETITADDDHYVYAGELLDIPNHSFVQIAIDGEIETKSNGNDLVSLPNIIVEVVFDNPKRSGTYWKSMRYMRALYQVLSNFESSIIEIGGLQLTKAIPMVVAYRERQLVVSGVQLSVALS